jgi:hypothetical protein
MTTPRIAKRRPYPDFVKSVEVTTHDAPGIGETFRTILRVVFADGDGVGVFIGANPSRALGDGSDATVNKVLRWFRAQGVAEVYIFNLSPYRATDAADAVRWLGEPDNLALSERVNAAAHAKLDELLSAATPPLILAGWGDCLKRHVREFVWPSLPLNVERPLVYHLPLTKAGNPGHPLYPSLTNLLTRRGLP